MNFFEQLLTSPSQKSTSPELLELLGHKAARLFLDEKVPLNEGIVKVVGDHPDMNNEHVKRVIEFANNAVFQEIFEKSEDKNVHFDVGDPGVVIRDLKDGGSPAFDGKVDDKDYHLPPGDNSKDTKDDYGLKELFGQENKPDQGENIEKTAGSHANPVDDVYDLHLKLKAAKREIEGSYENFDLLEKDAQEGLYQAIRKEVLGDRGSGLGGVIGALIKVAARRDDVFEILSPMMWRLVEEGVAPAEELKQSLEKTAGRLVNLQHPLVQAWCGLTKLSEEKHKIAFALAEIEDGLSQTTRFLRRAR